MLETLKFVSGSVSRREEFLPALNHFRIESGRVMGYNGLIALSSPIDLDLECSPRAVPFVKAIETCQDVVQFHMTAGLRLAIKSGKFSAFVECLPEGDKLPQIEPAGEEIDLGGNIFMDAIKKLAPFIARDASRPWARGILIRHKEGYGSSAYATNNIILIERWLGPQVFPNINIPEEAVLELLRIGNTPVKIVADERSIGFHYLSDRWLRTQLLSTEWPDITSYLDVEGGGEKIPDGFFEGLKTLLPFINELEQVYLLPGRAATERQEDLGASSAIEGLPEAGAWNLKQMLLLEKVALTMGLSRGADSRVPFLGDHTRGIICGMRT